ncbi:MAG: SpoIID/LytB domain-containing protein [Actinomycetes bacterium]
MRSRKSRVEIARPVALGLAAAAVVLASSVGTGPVAQAGSGPVAFTVSGAGWGHGVGLSQFGARGMASEGYSAVQIVSHYFTGAQVGGYPDTGDLRVNIGHGLTSVWLRAKGLAVGGGNVEVTLGSMPAALVPAGQELRLTASGRRTVVHQRVPGGKLRLVGSARVVVVRWAGTRAPGSAGSAPTYLQIGKGSRSYRTDAKYRWGLVDVATVGGRLEVVNSVRIHDEYLNGVSEVPSSWPSAALQAQAIAARSYALAHVAIRGACRCQSDDGFGGYYDQTFLGYARATQPLGGRWVSAVGATATSPTAGRTLTYGGKPIAAFYFSSSGGRTQNSEDVWGSALPYARSVDDHWSLNPAYNPVDSNWTVKVSGSRMAALFGLGNVVRVQVSARDASGGVKSVTAVSASGRSKTIGGSQFAVGVGAKSLWIKSVA